MIDTTGSQHAMALVAATTAALLAWPVLARDSLPLPTPVLPPEAARQRTQEILDSRCASCHAETWRTLGGPRTSGIALDDLAQNPSLIVPGQPDASRLYHMLLTRHRHPGMGAAVGVAGAVSAAERGTPEPSAADVEAVRDWISDLPHPAQDCLSRAPPSPQSLASLAVEYLSESPPAGDLRFASLAPLATACRGPEALMQARDELARALSALAPRPVAPRIETIGDDHLLVAVRLDDLSLTAGEWEALTAEAPRAAKDVVPADWLAFKAAGRATALGRNHAADVDLIRAAAEMGVTPARLEQHIGDLAGPDAKPALQLRQNPLTRETWEHVHSLLDPARAKPPRRSADAGLGHEFGLWSDKTAYATGELATITARTSRDCYLTLISVDAAGIGVVLLPNDFDEDNLLRAGTTITLPMRSASYQLRAKAPGRESIIAVCSASREPPHGIEHDFEPHRFTVLGDWRSFLRLSMQRELRPRNARRGAPPPVTPPFEMRTAISFEVR